MPAVLGVFYFGFQVIYFLELWLQVKNHVVTLTTASPGGTDKNNGLVSWKAIKFFLQPIHGDIDCALEMTHGILVRIAHIHQINAVRSFLHNFFESRNVNGAFFRAGLDSHSCRCSTIDHFPCRIATLKHFDIGIPQLYRPPGGLVTEFSGIAAAIKNQQHILIGGQFAL